MPWPDDGEGHKPAILVVDDTPESLRLLTTTLSLAGMTVLAARDGEAAVALLGHVCPDLIVMDALMPGMDGFETTRRIKANPAFQQVPVIFMTGLTETDDVVRALNAGAIDYVRKPVIVEELLARIHIHLMHARVAHASRLALDTSGRPTLSVDARGIADWLTPMACEMIVRAFPDWPATSRALPAPLREALCQLQGAAAGAEAATVPGASIPVQGGASTLEAILLGRTAIDHWLFRLAERREGEEERLLAARLGLTSRESEVLLWISRGKQNREISEILSISPRTVNKHLEQVYEKMGVENRASATAIAVAMLAN